MARARSNAFDEEREELDQADVQPLSSLLGGGPKRDVSSPAQPSASADQEPRGRGGRPRGNRRRQITQVPARVPQSLYRAAAPLTKGVGCPSWGQLVAWTCRDHRQDVAAATQQMVQEWEDARDRGPAGVANQVAEGTSQVTARVTQAELEWLLAVLRDVPDATRTEVVIASLRVAVESEAGEPL